MATNAELKSEQYIKNFILTNITIYQYNNIN